MSGWRTVTPRGPKTHPSMGRSSSPCFTYRKGSEVSGRVWGSRVAHPQPRPRLGLWQQLEGMESGERHAPTLSLLCPGSWHHIQNLDSFFTKISFLCAAWQKGHGRQGDGCCGLGTWRGIGRRPQEKPIMLKGDFLTCGHIYSYHQRNGFTCILLEDVFQLG